MTRRTAEPEKLLIDGLRRIMETDADARALIEKRFDCIVSLLGVYMDEIELFNPAYGLVGAKTRDALILRHILDSLAPLGILYRLLKKAPSPCLADAGSGAGLPGIPLAVSLPGTPVTLIERMGRRSGFLRNSLALLGLANTRVAETEIRREKPASFGLIVFRAFKPLETEMLKTLFRILLPGGFLAAYKGKRELIEAETAAILKNPPPNFSTSVEIIPCPVPFLEEERHLVVIGREG
jgi:16S rRNA (guanine527-N7)-methyltransferase